MDDSIKLEVQEVTYSNFHPFEDMTNLCDEDIKEKLEPLMFNISDKIKQLTRDLANTGSKKLKLMKQFENLSMLEEKIQQQLKEEMYNEKRLKELMTERTERLKMSINSVCNDSDVFNNHPTDSEYLDTSVLKLENGKSVETLLDMRCTSNDEYASSTELDLEVNTSIPTVDPDMTTSYAVTPISGKRASQRLHRKKVVKSKCLFVSFLHFLDIIVLSRFSMVFVILMQYSHYSDSVNQLPTKAF